MRTVHRKTIRKLTFRALALRRSESRNCGLCVVYIQKDGVQDCLNNIWQSAAFPCIKEAWQAAKFYKPHTTHNSSICSDEGLTLETSAFESLRWRIHIINSVDKTKLSCYTSRWRSATVSIETRPLRILFSKKHELRVFILVAYQGAKSGFFWKLS